MVSICAAFVLTSVTAHAQQLPPAERDAVLKDFIAKQSSTKTFQSGLEQTLRLQGLREPVQSTGQIYFEAPDRLAIKYSQPAGEFVIADGADVYMKRTNQPLRHRHLDPADRQRGGQMAYMLDLFQNGATNTLAHYDATVTRTNGALLVTLTPKVPQPQSREPSKIDTWVTQPVYELQSMGVHFENQNSMTYRFVAPVRDQIIDPTVFHAPQEPVK